MTPRSDSRNEISDSPNQIPTELVGSENENSFFAATLALPSLLPAPPTVFIWSQVVMITWSDCGI
jgi:hypothetical protein